MKQPFDIDQVLARVGEAIGPFPKAAMFELAEAGYGSVFEQLVGCIISIRTRDETTIPTALKLFGAARTPEAMAKLTARRIDQLIQACTFHEPKSKNILALARRARDEFGGTLPCDAQTLMSFSGVGQKCAHLVMGVACGKPFISVDVHVHRVTNRWGYVDTRGPKQTTAALEKQLPRRYWIEINKLLVPFGKHICTGSLPKCSTCPVLKYCRQVGVGRHR